MGKLIKTVFCISALFTAFTANAAFYCLEDDVKSQANLSCYQAAGTSDGSCNPPFSFAADELYDADEVQGLTGCPISSITKIADNQCYGIMSVIADGELVSGDTMCCGDGGC